MTIRVIEHFGFIGISVDDELDKKTINVGVITELIHKFLKSKKNIQTIPVDVVPTPLTEGIVYTSISINYFYNLNGNSKPK